MTACADCEAARLHAKADGFRDWRTGYACWTHAAFDLSGPEWAAMTADVTPAMIDRAARELGLMRRGPPGEQLDLFA